MLGFISSILRTILEEIRPVYEDLVKPQDPRIKLENQIRALYGRGDLSRERYFEQLNKLRWNQIGAGDIQLLQQEARLRHRTQSGLAEWEGSSPSGELARGKERLFVDRGIVEELRAEIEQTRAGLVEETHWIHAQLAEAQTNAQVSLPEESEAQAYLDVWQELLGLASTFETQLAAQAEDLRQLKLLDAELKMHISEMKILDARERFARLKLRIYQDLYPHPENGLRK
jgi:hypothetical protein